jgi:hemoglobin
VKTDILSRNDIHFIIADFYKKLVKDTTMYPFFKDIVEQDQLESHLEIITDFWEDLLFQTYKYKNNPMEKHLEFHQKMNFTKKHFERWLQYLSSTIDAQFMGFNSENMKTRALSIANVMQVKMNLYES